MHSDAHVFMPRTCLKNHRFFLPVVQSQTIFYRDTALADIDSTNDIRSLLVIMFVVLSQILFSFYYLPLIKRLDDETTRTSTLLLMLPIEILASRPDITEKLDTVLQLEQT
jgi:hypothetical protein